MIIWGSGGKLLELGPAGTAMCPNCEQQRAFHNVLAYRYAHIWYLFSWVTKKQYMTVCDTCSQGHQVDTKAFEAKAGKPAIPFYRRFGGLILLGLIALVVILGMVTASKVDAEDTQMLSHPRVGDLYTVDLDAVQPDGYDGHAYGVIRVTAVDDSSVEVQLPRSGYSRWKGASKDARSAEARTDGYYVDETLTLPMSKLETLHGTRDLRHVYR